IDLTKPIVTSILPLHPTTVSNNTVIFQYNVTDNYGELSNCSLILNESIYATEYDPIENITLNFTRTLTGGYYIWRIECVDRADNYGYSESKILNVTDPDFAVYTSELIFSNNNPVEGEIVQMNATIHNIGNENAKDVYVKFFEDEPYEKQIGNDFIIDIQAGSNITLSVNWNAKIGKYNIHVVVDPPYETNGSITELDESNNVANNTLFIPVNHIYYGSIISDIMLAGSSMAQVIGWFNSTYMNGNIYAADSDSVIDWNSLMAIGRDISNNQRIEDFEKVDEALNLSDFIDSINKTYTYDSKVMATGIFDIYGHNVENVPIINSTNNSNFVTGILWDSSDANPGYYNGNQDLIFITKINQSAQGSYGLYDYEIRVPANLRQYVQPNNNNKISFYIELR
ncbi:MAG: CARDB domain-containing protein, partial [Candidatus Nanoarchaeia archaeon]|nr:CARDB domain-containing protein [Candidatus Nanoarchaeia archaeon]